MIYYSIMLYRRCKRHRPSSCHVGCFMIAIHRPQTRFAAALPAAAPTNVTVTIGRAVVGASKLPRPNSSGVANLLSGGFFTCTHIFPRPATYMVKSSRYPPGRPFPLKTPKKIDWVCLRDLVVTMCTASAATMCCVFKFRVLRESWSHSHRDRIEFRLFNSIFIFNITLR